MRTKFFNLLGSILFSIFRAEDNRSLKTGEDKLEAVRLETDVKLGKLGLGLDPTNDDYDELIDRVIQLIELIVFLLNFFGVFSRSTGTERTKR